MQKDPDHKNRCHVRFPEVFSTIPYRVNVTAVNALGRASTTLSFEESSIGKYRQPASVRTSSPAPKQEARAPLNTSCGLGGAERRSALLFGRGRREGGEGRLLPILV